MPDVRREHGVRFCCFSNDGVPPCVHVVRGEAHAKFWLIPPHLAESAGFEAAELRRIRHIVEESANGLLAAWSRVCD